MAEDKTEDGKEAEEPQETGTASAEALAQSEQTEGKDVANPLPPEQIFGDLAKEDEDENNFVETSNVAGEKKAKEPPAEESAAEDEGERKKPDEAKSEEKPEDKPETEAKPGEDSKPEDEKAEDAATSQQEPVVTAARDEPAQTPEQIAEAQREWRKTTVEKLATEHFALDEETKAAFGEEAASAISRLQAKTFLDSVENATLAMLQLLPQAISHITSTQRSDQELEQQFFSQWPALKKDEHSETIRRLATSYRNANPKMDAETFIRDVGVQAMVALKLELPNTTTTQPGSDEAVAAKPTPPVSQGSPSGKPPPKPGVFEQLAEEDIEEELSGF